MSKKKLHFDYLSPLRWNVFHEHKYKLEAKHKTLMLSAQAKTTNMGKASTLDHFIWEEIVQKKSSKWCDCLTLWTEDLEFNLLVFGEDHTASRLRCAYFAAPEEEMCTIHLKFWGIIANGGEVRKKHTLLQNLKFYIDQAKKNPRNIPQEGAKFVKKLLPQIVVWNRYSITRITRSQGVIFSRINAYTLDPFRHALQTMPVPTGFLEEQVTPFRYISNSQQAAQNLYRQVLQRYDTVAGCGSPMKRNLLTLASLLADPNIKVALVTGEPGTGKENLCKAIYYGNKVRRPANTTPEAVFLQTTAVEIQTAMKAVPPKTPTQFLKEKLNEQNLTCSKANRPVLFIDELNKAEPAFLAAMLRPLEQGENELDVDGSPKFVLAASQHIDDLAKNPPQDFWTRVSHQLRVAHPLSRVSEDDGEAFLTSFFYSQWWLFLEPMVRGHETTSAKNFIEIFLGSVSRKGELNPSLLCKRVKDEFVNTLVPLVSRDTLSVRGARSMLSQVFARLSWFVRFEDPMGKKLDTPTENTVARLVNSAVQDVMAILNPARGTPAGMDDTKQSKK